MIDQREGFERAFQRFEMPEPAFERLTRRRERKQRTQRIAAGVVGIAVFVASVWAVTSRDPADPERTPGSSGGVGPTAPAPVLDASWIPGLPPEGTLSTPVDGELVLQQESPYGSLSVYEDGSLLWWPGVPDTEDTVYSGLTIQRLTPEGIEYLRSATLATGLFTHDLELDGGGTQPFLRIQVRDGGRLVEVRLAWEGALPHPDVPEATAEQERALDTLAGLLSHPELWPANAWADQTARPFVPERYQICFRGFPKHLRSSEIRALLPPAANDVLGVRPGPGPWGACPALTPDEARAFAEALEAADLAPMMARTWLRYNLAVPDPARDEELWIFFAPELPHGEAIFLGPG